MYVKKISIIYMKFHVPIIEIQGLFSHFKYAVPEKLSLPAFFSKSLHENYNIHVFAI